MMQNQLCAMCDQGRLNKFHMKKVVLAGCEVRTYTYNQIAIMLATVENGKKFSLLCDDNNDDMI